MEHDTCKEPYCSQTKYPSTPSNNTTPTSTGRERSPPPRPLNTARTLPSVQDGFGPRTFLFPKQCEEWYRQKTCETGNEKSSTVWKNLLTTEKFAGFTTKEATREKLHSASTSLHTTLKQSSCQPVQQKMHVTKSSQVPSTPK